MARHIRYAGLASIVVVEDDSEIDTLIDRADLDRTYKSAGPPLNRLMISRLRHALFRDGQALLSFAPRGDANRAAVQTAFAKRVDALAQERPWDPKAIAVLAAYVANGTDRGAALAALAYVTAFPFLAPADTAYEEAKFRRLFAAFEILQLARAPWKGMRLRLLRKDKEAAKEILQMTSGEDYGLHAVGVTLANSLLILDRHRAFFAGTMGSGAQSFDWSKIRTAPAVLTRQNSAPCTLPGIDGEIPANTLFMLKTRQALRPGSPDGFEFARKHWSFCPASRYIETVFATVDEAAERSRAFA